LDVDGIQLRMMLELACVNCHTCHDGFMVLDDLLLIELLKGVRERFWFHEVMVNTVGVQVDFLRAESDSVHLHAGSALLAR